MVVEVLIKTNAAIGGGAITKGWNCKGGAGRYGAEMNVQRNYM